MPPTPIVECVPNFSEGRDPSVLQNLAAAIKRVPEVRLLHIDAGKAANRTVFTFAGPLEAVVESAYQAIRVAAERIDMRQHRGEHPRIGATDVCPLVPITDCTLEEVNAYTLQLAERVGEQLQIPVFLYEHSARHAYRKNLAHIRSGEYEGLAAKTQLPDWRPDFGPLFNARSGASVIGARNFLIAYNVNLNTSSVALANEIARDIRESGRLVHQPDGQRVRQPGRCRFVKAIGWFIEEYNCAQVSLNLTNFQATGLYDVYENCRELARRYGCEVTGSELIGLIPKAALMNAGRRYAQLSNKKIHSSDEELLSLAVRRLGLDQLAPFDYRNRVIEYLL